MADFVRHFTVPDGIDVEKIDASLANGVLRLRLPKVTRNGAPARLSRRRRARSGRRRRRSRRRTGR
ncbi:MAG: Hsp20/alpha crystallin family protein [bacterium]